MNSIEKLEQQFSSQQLKPESLSLDELETIIDSIRSYVNIEQGIAVMSNLIEHTSYVFIGGLGASLGLTPNHEYKIDSIWEEGVYSKIHHDDLLQRHFLEQEFFSFLCEQPKESRLAFQTRCILRAKTTEGEYRDIEHKTLYLKMDSKGGLALALCLYNVVGDKPNRQGIHAEIINKVTGEAIPVKTVCNNKQLLTKREYQVLTQVEQGRLSKEIASELNISINTVNRHRQNILEKLQVQNSVEAISAAKALRLI